MRVQRMLLSGTRAESWTVLGEDGVPIETIERWLAYLSDVDWSPNTVKAYAHDVKDFFVFLAMRELDWREVRLEDIGEFVAWLALPSELRGGPFSVVRRTAASTPTAAACAGDAAWIVIDTRRATGPPGLAGR